MEDAILYLEKLAYPVVISQASSKLLEMNCLDDDLLYQIIVRNFRSIIKKFSARLKQYSKKQVSRATNELIQVAGIPNIPTKLLDEVETYCNEDYLGWAEFSKLSKQDVISELEQKFYKFYLKDLLKRKELSFSIRIKEYLKSKRKTNIFNFSQVLDIQQLKHISEEQMLAELNVNIQGISKLVPSIKKQLSIKGTFKLEKLCKMFIEKKTLDFMCFDVNNKNLRETIANAFGLIQIVSVEFTSDTYKPVTQFLVTKAFGFGQEPNEITENMWKSMDLDKRVEIYIACYLLLSEDIYILRRVETSKFTEFLNNRFSPVAQEILYSISKTYPLFHQSKSSSKKIIHNSKKFMNLVDQVTSLILPSSRKHLKTIHFNENSQVVNFLESRNMKNFNLTKLNDSNSKHVIICVSGYLSESDDHQDAWKQIIKLFPFTTIYTFLWESSSYSNFAKHIWGYIKRCHSSIFSDFHESTERAMQSGIYLAEMIQTNFLDKGFCVSLYGFSLGTLVLTACMAELRNYPQYSLYEVIYFGSATSVDEASEMEEFKRNVVYGRLINVYSTQDYTLWYLYKKARECRACGTGQVNGMENIDASDIVNGHLYYRSNFSKVFKKVWS